MGISSFLMDAIMSREQWYCFLVQLVPKTNIFAHLKLLRAAVKILKE